MGLLGVNVDLRIAGCIKIVAKSLKYTHPMTTLVPPLTDRDREMLHTQDAHLDTNEGFTYDLASRNFLGLSPGDEPAKAIRRYGVGACGPRGFYGTFDIHLDLERELAQFLNMEATIIYPSALSAVTSVLPVFVGRQDVLVCDDGVAYPLQCAMRLSGAPVYWFRHQNMEDLERVLSCVPQVRGQRRYIVCEGLYQDSGDVVPLRAIIELRTRYRFGLIVDECHSFGVLGRTGRGITEECEVPASTIDLLIGSMETTLGSVGGFCAGTQELINHQTLNGQAYCFSAALPLPLVAAARETLKLLRGRGEAELLLLRQQVRLFYSRFIDAQLRTFSIRGAQNPHSPIIHIEGPNETALRVVVEQCRIAPNSMQVSLAQYCTGGLRPTPRPSIRLCIKAHCNDDKWLLKLVEELKHQQGQHRYEDTTE